MELSDVLNRFAMRIAGIEAATLALTEVIGEHPDLRAKLCVALARHADAALQASQDRLSLGGQQPAADLRDQAFAETMQGFWRALGR